MFSLKKNRETLLLRLDRLGEVKEVSHTALELSGMDPSRLVGTLIYDFIEQIFEQPEADQIINKVAETLTAGIESEIATGTEALESERLVLRPNHENKELFDLLLIGEGLDRKIEPELNKKTEKSFFRDTEFAERAHIYIVRTDRNFQINEVYGDVEGLVGIPTEQLFFNPTVWTQILKINEARRLLSVLKSQIKAQETIEEEVQVLNLKTGRRKWVLIKALPLFGSDGEHLGWEGVGIDSTARKEAELRLKAQGKRLAALYQVSRSLDLTHDTAQVAFHGLRSLMQALPAAGLGFIFLNRSQPVSLELNAAIGLSEDSLDDFQVHANQSVLLQEALDGLEPIYIPDLAVHPELAHQFKGIEGIRSIVISPMNVDSSPGARGVLILASYRKDRFSDLDLDLIKAVTKQLTMVVIQSEFFLAEKQQSSALSALYQLSHELTHVFTTKDIAEKAFPIIQEQVPCKRGWFGVLTDNATHIAGESGFGPGMRTRLINVQIELSLRHDFFDQAIKTKQAVIVPAGAKMECSGLTRIVNRLEIGTMVIIPLVSLGRVVGVLVLEPLVSSPEFLRGRLPLLSSMASELASVVYARKFENRVAEAQKMKMAGLLASGIAHNFNNLLQAILGQAQLLELQLKDFPQYKESIKTIVTAGTQGASLLKQLISMTATEDTVQQKISLKKILDESKELYRSLLPENVNFDILVPSKLPEIFASVGEVKQVISNLIINARDAVQFADEPKVTITAAVTSVASAEIDPALPPGRYLRVDIEDNGIGMTNDQLARCFEPFYTTKNWDPNSSVGVSGSGLGLSISYATLKKFGGLLTVSSKPGDGSIFSMYFPLIDLEYAKVDAAINHLSENYKPDEQFSKGSSVLEKIVETTKVDQPLIQSLAQIKRKNLDKNT